MSDFLSCLNEPQKEAVLDFDHSLLVLAGAGSGKTRVITSKIVHALLEEGYRPWQILAVTFTNKAAREMRDRVESMLAPYSGIDISPLEIKTFHSYGAGLLRRYASAIGYPSTFNIYDDSDSQSLFQSLYPELDKASVRAYCKRISLLKDRGIGPDECEEEDLPLFRMRYKAYERKLRESQCMDFADLIIRANELLETDEEIRSYIRRRYRLILVDEYQDSNGSQFRLLKNITGEGTQLVVVGDDDQSIYRFRGAEIGNILHFESDYSNVRVIKLEENYRSTKSIIALSSALISKNRSRHEKTLFTNNEQGELPRILNCYNEADEAMQVSSLIMSALGSSDTAVLFRTNAQSRAFEECLTRCKIRYQVVGALRFYEREEVKDMLAVFSFLLNPRDQVSFSRIINKPARGVGKTSVQKIIDFNPHLADSMRELAVSGQLTRSAKSGVEAFLCYYDEAKKRLEDCSSLSDFATWCMNEFGIYSLYEKEADPAQRRARLENLSSLVAAVSGYQPSYQGLSDFLESITLDSSSLPGSEETNRISADKTVVKLITMHNTKGLEFDTVFVTGLEDDIIPGSRAGMTESDVEEERRILYVAMTRARKQLYLSWACRRMMWGSYMNQIPCRFFSDLPQNLYRGQIARGREVTSSSSSYTQRYAYTSRIHDRSADSQENRFPEPEVRKTERVKNTAVFRAGDRIYSPDYGEGVIVSADIKGDKTIVRVSYDSGRKSIYNTAFCNLKKL